MWIRILLVVGVLAISSGCATKYWKAPDPNVHLRTVEEVRVFVEPIVADVYGKRAKNFHRPFVTSLAEGLCIVIATPECDRCHGEGFEMIIEAEGGKMVRFRRTE